MPVGQMTCTELFIPACALHADRGMLHKLGAVVGQEARKNLAVIAPEASQTIGVVLADAGYISEKNLAGIDSDGPKHLIATKNGWKQRRDNVGTPGRLVVGESHIETADGTYVADTLV